jgi:hypothetical protein
MKRIYFNIILIVSLILIGLYTFGDLGIKPQVACIQFCAIAWIIGFIFRRRIYKN